MKKHTKDSEKKCKEDRSKNLFETCNVHKSFAKKIINESNFSKKLDYKSAGVNREAGYKTTETIKRQIKNKDKNVLWPIGSFSAPYKIPKGYKEPVLVSGADGVGTKLKIAFMLEEHSSVGIDLVAMCVNDVICSGAKPLYFLDYIAVPKLIPKKIKKIIEGIIKGCEISECSLIGGETAEMPEFYKEDEYDIAGFCTGIVENENLINSRTVIPGDILLGLPSSGVHSNGFSLIRKIFDLDNKTKTDEFFKYREFLGKSLIDELITPTRIYYKELKSAINSGKIKSMCHITGGGFYENILRATNNYGAKIEYSSLSILPIFDLIKNEGDITIKEMFSTFNMGIGFILIVSANDVESVIDLIKNEEVGAPYVIGEIIKENTLLMV